MGRLGEAARRAAAITAAAVGVLALSSCGNSAPATFRITEMKHATAVYVNGPKYALTVWWTGNPTFPVTWTDFSGASYVFNDATNPLVWPDATYYVASNPDPSAPAQTQVGEAWLTDANGVESNHMTLHTTFANAPVATAFEDIVVTPPEPAIVATLRAPSQVSWAPVDVTRSAVLAAGALLVIAFPSQLFNSTLQAHYGEVMGWFGFLRRPASRLMQRRRRVRAEHPRDGRAAPPRSPPWAIVLVLGLGGLLGALLDPHFGFDTPSLEGLLGIFVAVVMTTAVSNGTTALTVRALARAWGGLRVYRGGIAIAVACMALSRLTGAQPGYLYGVMLGYVLASHVSLPRHHQGRLVALTSASVLGFSVAVWALWTPVKSAADQSGSFWLLTLSTAMSAIFLAGMTSVLFGLLPLRFLDGEKLLAWRRPLWIGLAAVAMFLFVHVVLNPTPAAANQARSLAVTITMFCLFGLLSTGFWAYFRFRREPAPPTVGAPPPPVAAPARVAVPSGAPPPGPPPRA